MTATLKLLAQIIMGGIIGAATAQALADIGVPWSVIGLLALALCAASWSGPTD